MIHSIVIGVMKLITLHSALSGPKAPGQQQGMYIVHMCCGMCVIQHKNDGLTRGRSNYLSSARPQYTSTAHVRPRTPGNLTTRYTATCDVPMDDPNRSESSRQRGDNIYRFTGQRPSSAGALRRPYRPPPSDPPQSDPYVEGIRLAQVRSALRQRPARPRYPTHLSSP